MTELEIWEQVFTDQCVTYQKVYVAGESILSDRIYLRLTESPFSRRVDSETIIWFNGKGELVAVQLLHSQR